MGSGSPENDSRSLPPDSTKKYLPEPNGKMVEQVLGLDFEVDHDANRRK